MKRVFRYVRPSLFVIAGVSYVIVAAAQGSAEKIIAGVIVAILGVAFFFVAKMTTKEME